jgi:mannose-6-phosphate isomerase-like protein (cupin superfamily)
MAGEPLEPVVSRLDARRSDTWEERMSKVNVQDGLSRFDDLWRPKIIAELNDYKVQLVKGQGELVWHQHEDTDELFFVIAGRLTMQTREGDMELGPGDLLVMPKGVEHCPKASDVCQLLLIEPFGTPNTGDAGWRADPTGRASWRGTRRVLLGQPGTGDPQGHGPEGGPGRLARPRALRVPKRPTRGPRAGRRGGDRARCAGSRRCLGVRALFHGLGLR